MMGILSKLIAFPLAPVYGVVWIGERLAEYANDEMYGEAAIRRALSELDTAYEAGEISDREREERESDLLELLEAQRKGGER
jgi:hypothetical protein